MPEYDAEVHYSCVSLHEHPWVLGSVLQVRPLEHREKLDFRRRYVGLKQDQEYSGPQRISLVPILEPLTITLRRVPQSLNLGAVRHDARERQEGACADGECACGIDVGDGLSRTWGIESHWDEEDSGLLAPIKELLDTTIEEHFRVDVSP